MDYPKHMFRSPGPYGHGAASWDVIGCDSPEREAELLEQGWHASKDTAIGVADGDEVPDLRAEYTRISGKRPFMGWGADKLREKIIEAQTQKGG